MKSLNEAILKLFNCNQSLNIFFGSVKRMLCSALKTPSEVWEFFSDKIFLVLLFSSSYWKLSSFGLPCGLENAMFPLIEHFVFKIGMRKEP